MAVLARWESRGGAHYVELRKSAGGYGYTGCGCGGSLGAVESDQAAVAVIQARVDSGYFLPDNAKLPMKRVVPIVSGPTYNDVVGAWEVTVSLMVYSDKLASQAFNVLPEYLNVDGHVYRKGGMKAADCTAWYRSSRSCGK